MSTLSESSSVVALSPPHALVTSMHSSSSRSSSSRSSPSGSSPLRSAQLCKRLGAWIGALLLMVSCMPAHVASDSPRDADTRERLSKTYHVQVRTVEAKSEADQAVSEVMTWFDDLDRDERPLPLSRVSTVPVDVRWKAPFYRVRVGPFTSKEAAESVLQSVQRRFPDAFIAKEIIEDDPASRRTLWYESPTSGSLDDWNRSRDWDRDDWDPDDQGRRDDWQKRDDERWEDVRRDRLERTRDRRERQHKRNEEARRDRPHENEEAEQRDVGDKRDERDDDRNDGGW